MIGSLKMPARASVGQLNICTAFQVLEMERLRVAASDVGGLRGRKILFSAHTGEVFLRRLRKSDNRDFLAKKTATAMNRIDLLQL
jgi:chemotaxis receptor (MCP) glutamine deamidase CheD